MNSDCAKKIQALDKEFAAGALLGLFTATINDAEEQKLPSATLAIPLFDENSGLQSGDWAPELHIVVRRIE